MSATDVERAVTRPIPLVSRLIFFATRRLQMPSYVGLILAQAVYVASTDRMMVHLDKPAREHA